MIQLPGRFVNGGFEKNEKIRIPNKRSGKFWAGTLKPKETREKGKFIFPNFGAFFAGNTGHFELVVLL